MYTKREFTHDIALQKRLDTGLKPSFIAIFKSLYTEAQDFSFFEKAMLDRLINYLGTFINGKRISKEAFNALWDKYQFTRTGKWLTKAQRASLRQTYRHLYRTIMDGIEAKSEYNIKDMADRYYGQYLVGEV